jgi:hypothetical protein
MVVAYLYCFARRLYAAFHCKSPWRALERSCALMMWPTRHFSELGSHNTWSCAKMSPPFSPTSIPRVSCFQPQPQCTGRRTLHGQSCHYCHPGHLQKVVTAAHHHRMSFIRLEVFDNLGPRLIRRTDVYVSCWYRRTSAISTQSVMIDLVRAIASSSSV